MTDAESIVFAIVLGLGVGWGLATLQQILVLDRLIRRMRRAIAALESELDQVRRDPRA